MQRCLQLFCCVVQLLSALLLIRESESARSTAFVLSLVVGLIIAFTDDAILILLLFGCDQNTRIRISIPIVQFALSGVMATDFVFLATFYYKSSSVLLSLALLQVVMMIISTMMIIGNCSDNNNNNNNNIHTLPPPQQQHQLILPNPELPPPAYETLTIDPQLPIQQQHTYIDSYNNNHIHTLPPPQQHHQQLFPNPESPPPAYETLMIGPPPPHQIRDVNTTVMVMEQQEDRSPSYAITNSSTSTTDDSYCCSGE